MTPIIENDDLVIEISSLYNFILLFLLFYIIQIKCILWGKNVLIYLEFSYLF